MDVDTLEEFVAAHSDAETTDNGKVRCTLTGHEMPALLPTVQAYWGGKKYRNTKARSAYDFAQHEPHIVPNKRDPRKMFCHRTKLHLNKVPEEVELHVKGRRFRARMQEWEAKQKRRALKLARTQAKAEGRAARAAAAAALGSDDEEDPVLAKFAHLAGDSDSEDLSSDDDDEVPGADSDAEGEGEMDEARTARQHYNTGRLAAQAQAQKQAQPAPGDDEGSDFEVVAGADSSGSDSKGGMDHSSMEEDASESEPEPTAAKKLSIARHAARHERDAAALKKSQPGKAAARKAAPPGLLCTSVCVGGG